MNLRAQPGTMSHRHPSISTFRPPAIRSREPFFPPALHRSHSGPIRRSQRSRRSRRSNHLKHLPRIDPHFSFSRRHRPSHRSSRSHDRPEYLQRRQNDHRDKDPLRATPLPEDDLEKRSDQCHRPGQRSRQATTMHLYIVFGSQEFSFSRSLANCTPIRRMLGMFQCQIQAICGAEE
ncbi:hypothetical protein OAI75_01375 [Woeseiaceae bacterium]|nr:hypothetical protein [Woeseiaceae bacterium]